jgi:hypothetical protein
MNLCTAAFSPSLKASDSLFNPPNKQDLSELLKHLTSLSDKGFSSLDVFDEDIKPLSPILSSHTPSRHHLDPDENISLQNDRKIISPPNLNNIQEPSQKSVRALKNIISFAA